MLADAVADNKTDIRQVECVDHAKSTHLIDKKKLQFDMLF